MGREIRQVAEGHQIYETVSEKGTPTSPVFKTLDAMREWLVRQGYSKKAVAVFINHGWAPSAAIVNGKIFGPGIDTFDAPGCEID